MSQEFEEIGYKGQNKSFKVSVNNFEKEWNKLDLKKVREIEDLSKKLHGRYWNAQLSLIVAFNEYLRRN